MTSVAVMAPPWGPQFSFSSCKFKVQKSKEGTGRVVMWRMGIANSYTIEVAFGGSTLGEGQRCGWHHTQKHNSSPKDTLWGLVEGCSRLLCCPVSPSGGRNSHFTVEDLKSLGYHLCDTLLDFCDPSPAKVGR